MWMEDIDWELVLESVLLELKDQGIIPDSFHMEGNPESSGSIKRPLDSPSGSESEKDDKKPKHTFSPKPEVFKPKVENLIFPDDCSIDTSHLNILFKITINNYLLNTIETVDNYCEFFTEYGKTKSTKNSFINAMLRHKKEIIKLSNPNKHDIDTRDILGENPGADDYKRLINYNQERLLKVGTIKSVLRTEANNAGAWTRKLSDLQLRSSALIEQRGHQVQIITKIIEASSKNLEANDRGYIISRISDMRRSNPELFNNQRDVD